MSELSPRQEQILRAVIVEYITAAEPVASELIAQKYELGVRSATVRNELAEITDLGLLEQPHTSAGRVPTASFEDLAEILLALSMTLGLPSPNSPERRPAPHTTEMLLVVLRGFLAAGQPVVTAVVKKGVTKAR